MRRLVIVLIGSVSLLGAGCDLGDQTDGLEPKPGDDSPAFQFEGVEAKDYRLVIPGFSLPGGIEKGSRNAFAAKRRDDASNNAALDLLREEDDPVPLATRAEPLSVRVSPAQPARATFIDNPSEGAVGELVVVDGLTDAPERRAVPEGVGVPSDGHWWGQNGNGLLFLNGYSEELHRGSLYWSDTRTSNLVGAGVPTYGVVLLRNRSAAVVALDVDASTRIGRLVRVNLADGELTEIASDVLAVEDRPWRRANFAVSADGSSVIFVGADGVVRRSSVSEPEATTIAESGNLPSVSADGSVVAFFDNGAAYASGPSGLAQLGSAVSNSYAAPVISEDGQWVFWCEDVGLSPGPLGATAYVALADGSIPPQPVGSNVACDQASFSGGQLTVLGDLYRFAVPEYRGFGILRRGVVGEPLQEFGVGVLAGFVRGVAGSGMVFTANQAQSDIQADVFYAAADGEPRKLQGNVLPRTLRVSPNGAHVLFMANVAGSEDQSLIGSTLHVSTPFPEAKLVEYPVTRRTNSPTKFYAAEFGIDSRVVAVSADDGTVWSFPRPK